MHFKTSFDANPGILSAIAPGVLPGILQGVPLRIIPGIFARKALQGFLRRFYKEFLQ